jgi:hypothetical protein
MNWVSAMEDCGTGREGKTVRSRSGKNLAPHRAQAERIRQIAAKLGIGVGTARTLQDIPKVHRGEADQ